MDILHEHATLIIASGYLILELAAIGAAVHAVIHVRTAQGAIAWLLALIAVPLLALPLYTVFGRRRFIGYVEARRVDDAAIAHLTTEHADEVSRPFHSYLSKNSRRYFGFETIAGTPFLTGNEVIWILRKQ